MYEDFEAQLAQIAGDLQAGGTSPRPPAREFIGWIGAKGRGHRIVLTLRQGLAKHGLATDADFESAYIDSPITFVLASDEPKVALPSETEIPDEGTDEAEAYRDPTHTVGTLLAGKRTLDAVTPNDSLEAAAYRMVKRDYSQLPVMTSKHDVKGAISWKSIGSRLAQDQGDQDRTVRQFMERCEVVDESDSLLSVISKVRQWDFVLVRDPHRQICGIVTAADLSEHLKELTEPFLLLGQIENHIRRLIGNRFSPEELQAVCDPSSLGREIKRVDNLTFGEYGRLLQDSARWAKLDVADGAHDEAVKDLERVREIRNRMVHFDPKGISPDDLWELRDSLRFWQGLHRREPQARRRPEAAVADVQGQNYPEHPQEPAGTTEAPPAQAAARRATAPSYGGTERKELIYAPSIEPRTFIHLSARKDLYALRSFGGTRPKARWKEPDSSTTAELLERHPIVHRVDVSGDGIAIAGEDHYWADRIAELNHKHGVG